MGTISNIGAVRALAQPQSAAGLLPTSFKVAQEGGGDTAGRGTAKKVEGLLSDTDLAIFHATMLSPSGGNYLIQQDLSLAGAAGQTYMRGTGGLVRLPDGVANSPTYFKQPAALNTATLLQRAFSGFSKTPGTQGLTGRMLALKPGQSFSFNDSNNKLIDIRPLATNDALRKQLSNDDYDLVKTLGNATFNTRAKVTVRYDGPAKGYTVTVQAKHSLLDRYNWNAGAQDSADAAARTTVMPDGNGGILATNHVDWFRMKEKFDAKDFSLGLAATETRTFKVSESQVRLGALSTPDRVTALMGNAPGMQVVSDKAAFKSQLVQAARENPKGARVTPNDSVSVMQPLKWDPKAPPLTVSEDDSDASGNPAGAARDGTNRIRR